MTMDTRHWRTNGAVDPDTWARLMEAPAPRPRLRPQVRAGAIVGWVVGADRALSAWPRHGNLQRLHSLLEIAPSPVPDRRRGLYDELVALVANTGLPIEVCHAEGETWVEARRPIDTTPIQIAAPAAALAGPRPQPAARAARQAA